MTHENGKAGQMAWRTIQSVLLSIGTGVGIWNVRATMDNTTATVRLVTQIDNITANVLRVETDSKRAESEIKTQLFDHEHRITVLEDFHKTH